jgi:ABC-type uncharacterized transport system permease subunit
MNDGLAMIASAACGLAISVALRNEPWWVRCLLALISGILVAVFAPVLL